MDRPKVYCPICLKIHWIVFDDTVKRNNKTVSLECLECDFISEFDKREFINKLGYKGQFNSLILFYSTKKEAYGG